MTHKGPGLYDFLIEAELQQYFTSLKNDLKVSLAGISLTTGLEAVWNVDFSVLIYFI